MWRFVAPAFEGRYRTVVFDFIGAGDSDLSAYDPQRHGGQQGYAADVLDVVRALDLRNVIFVGHSVSAMIGKRTSAESLTGDSRSNPQHYRFSRVAIT